MNKVWLTLMLLLMLLLLAATGGCRSGSNGVDGPEPGLFPVADLIDANEERLPPSPEPQNTGVEGKLTLSGMTVVDANGAALASPDFSRVITRLIDPEDDILVARPVNEDGTFELSVTSELTSAKVQVEIPVAEDLNQDSLPGDVVLQVVPVKLKAGSLAQLTLDISLGRAAEQPVFEPPLDPGAPFNDFLLISQLNLTDAGGSKDEYYGTFYDGNFVVYDQDGDQLFEPGDDFQAEDSDTDGYFDGADDQFFPPSGNGIQAVEGTLVSVNQAEQSITVRESASGAETVMLVPPFVGIEVYSDRLGFLGLLTLDQLRPGDNVYIEGNVDPSGAFLAQWIVVVRD